MNKFIVFKKRKKNLRIGWVTEVMTNTQIGISPCILQKNSKEEHKATYNPGLNITRTQRIFKHEIICKYKN